MRQAACAVTGHRPSRFKFKYSEDYSLCKKIKRAMLEQFKRLYDEHGVRRYYVGGALGVDMWAGELILRLKEQPGYSTKRIASHDFLADWYQTGISFQFGKKL